MNPSQLVILLSLVALASAVISFLSVCSIVRSIKGLDIKGIKRGVLGIEEVLYKMKFDLHTITTDGSKYLSLLEKLILSVSTSNSAVDSLASQTISNQSTKAGTCGTEAIGNQCATDATTGKEQESQGAILKAELEESLNNYMSLANYIDETFEEKLAEALSNKENKASDIQYAEYPEVVEQDTQEQHKQDRIKELKAMRSDWHRKVSIDAEAQLILNEAIEHGAPRCLLDLPITTVDGSKFKVIQAHSCRLQLACSEYSDVISKEVP